MSKKKHGMCGHPLYHIWTSMRQRCINPKDAAYHKYGGRGIKVCKRWSKFENFYEDMGPRPKGKSLDRINNSKGYSPSNCRWATHIEQALNTRQSIKITMGGVTKSAAQWSKTLGAKNALVSWRLRNGWDLKTAITAPRHTKYKGKSK